MEYVYNVPKVLTIKMKTNRCLYISRPDITFVEWMKEENETYTVKIKVKGVERAFEIYDASIDVANDILSKLSLPLIEKESTDGLCSAWESCDHYAICNGTKEREMCHCGGHKEKCDFYPEKRNDHD